MTGADEGGRRKRQTQERRVGQGGQRKGTREGKVRMPKRAKTETGMASEGTRRGKPVESNLRDINGYRAERGVMGKASTRPKVD